MRKLMMVAVVALAAAVFAEAKLDLVPNAAMQHLKGVRGKPIRTGVVFVCGQYLAPPYTVWRKGTAIYVNSVQVTGEIVPWRMFMATQEGAAQAPAPAADAPAAPKTAKSVDDLFDDAPAPVKKAAAAPVPEVTGPFTPNDRTRRYLKRINDYRTDVDRRLRRGEVLFFGASYSMLHVEDRLCLPLMAALPKALREAHALDDFQANLRASGITYLGASICEDLMSHQNQSFEIELRGKAMKEETDLYKFIDASAQKGVQ